MTRAAPIRGLIVAFCSRPGGANQSELKAELGSIATEIPPAVAKLDGLGRLFRAKSPGQLLRFFGHAADRDAWLVTARATANPRATAKTIPVIKKRELHPETYTAGASKIAPQTKGEPIITANTSVTLIKCKSLCARYQAQPSQPPVGFVALKIGGYF